MYFDIDAHRDCFKTNSNEAYFWHGQTNGCGGQNNAMDIAEQNNGKTLERCMIDNQDELTKAGVRFNTDPEGNFSISYGSNSDENYRFWDDCSKAFAEQSSGNIHVIDGSDPRPNGQSEAEYQSIYNRIEHPALEKNQDVNSITHVDPYTRRVTGVEQIHHGETSNPAENVKAQQNSAVAQPNNYSPPQEGDIAPSTFLSNPPLQRESANNPLSPENFQPNKNPSTNPGHMVMNDQQLAAINANSTSNTLQVSTAAGSAASNAADKTADALSGAGKTATGGIQ